MRLLIKLYGLQELADNGGIPWWTLGRRFDRKAITERGIFNIWGFTEGRNVASSAVVESALGLGPSNGKWSEAVGTSFWAIFDHLRNLGLIELVPHLVEAYTPEASMIVPCPDEYHNGTDFEHRLGEAKRLTAEALLGDQLSYHLTYFHHVLAVPRRYPKVELVGVYRLRYRPHTARTAAWLANSADHQSYLELMERGAKV